MTEAYDADLETQLMILDGPLGEMQQVRERERAAKWLLAHAERSYPRLLEAVENGTASLAVIELLPAFNRPESITPLESLLEASERIAWAAGQALARQKGPDALAALRRGVTSTNPDAVVAAADGLWSLGDSAACADLAAQLSRRDHRERYSLVRASGTLGCLSSSQLREISRSDPSPDIRSFAQDLLGRIQ